MLHLARPAAWIRAKGPDASSFLQSQFSNDLTRAQGPSATYGFWLDRKGRIAADSFVLKLGGEDFGIVSYHCEAAAIIEKLSAFIIADDVELEDHTAEAAVLSVCGAGAAAILDSWSVPLPPAGQYIEHESLYVMHGQKSAQESFELITRDEAGHSTIQKLLDAGPLVEMASEAQMELERIRSGIPRIPADAYDGCLPQELGVEHVGVSFNKGCYLGQEVMARVRQTGRFTRVLKSVDLDGDPGTLPVAVISGGEAVGEIRSAATDDGQWIGLGVFRRKFVDDPQPMGLESGTSVTFRAPSAPLGDRRP